MDTTHKNSEIVYVRRLPQFAAMARPELAEILAEGQRGYGAYFSPGSARTATGLSPTEEDLLLPYILNIPKDDKDFRKAVNVHYEGIAIKVPGKEGLKLEIGLEGSNSEPVSAENLPINIDNYLKYRHALGHPWMAASEADGKGNQLKQYYMFNPNEVSKVNINVNEQRDKALGLYLSIKDNVRTIRMYLTLLGVRTDQLRPGEEVLKLRELVDKNPNAFIDLSNDRNKEIKYIIEDMINNGILERVNGAILDKSDGTVVGQDMKAAMVFLQDTRNTKQYSVLKARLTEKWKKQTISFDTDEQLEQAQTPATPVVTTPVPKEEAPATELMPKQAEPEVALVEGAAADIDE